MKTYACGKCGNWRPTDDHRTYERCECGHRMHALDGIIHGGGVTAIWRDGKEIWSGTGHEAVEMLAMLLPGDNADYSYRGWTIDECDRDGRTLRIKSPDGHVRRVEFAGNEQAAEADQIVRKAAETHGTMTQTLEAMLRVRSLACDYVAKYPKT